MAYSNAARLKAPESVPTSQANKCQMNQKLRVFEILEQVVELPDDERANFLDQVCQDDVDLRRRVVRMLNRQEDAERLLKTVEADLIRTEHKVSVDSTNSATDLRLQPGHRLLQRYKIKELMGRGGMGEVYSADDLQLGREVAIKILSGSTFRDQQMRDRFDRELRAVASLSDPNVVTLHDVASDNDVHFAVMELVAGITLRKSIDAGIDGRSAVSIVRDVASGLESAHSHGIMHRDIKPENIMVGSNGNAKILDFGLARGQHHSTDQNLTASAMNPGTIPYMSPEQTEGGELSCATDIFSLGIVLYELLTGIHPFRGETSYVTIRKIVAAEPVVPSSINPDLPSGLDQIVAKMLARSPQTRPSAAQIREALDPLVGSMSSDLLLSKNLAKSETTKNQKSSQTNSRRTDSWQPSLIVLPFDHFGNDDQLEGVADALVDNLTTVLTRVPFLALKSRGSSFSLKGKAWTIQEISQKFGVDYAIEGSIQRTGGIIRASVQLVQAQTECSLWGQGFDCDDDDAAVTNLMQNILPRLEPQLVKAILNDLGDDSGQWNGRQLLIRASHLLALKGWHRDSFEEAAQMVQKSIELDPNSAISHAQLALIQGLGQRIGLVADPEAAIRETIEHADRALDLDDLDSNVIGLVGCALADVGYVDRAIPLLNRAIGINPMNAQAHAALGTALLIKKEYENAAQQLRKGINLSPADGRLAVWYAALAGACIRSGNSDEAVAAASAGCEADRKSYLPRIVLASVHLLRGEEPQAEAALKESFRVKPDLSQHEISHMVGKKGGKLIADFRRRIGV